MKLYKKESSLEHMKAIREQTIKKWQESGFLDDLTIDTKKTNIAELFECEAMQLLRKEEEEKKYKYLLIRR